MQGRFIFDMVVVTVKLREVTISIPCGSGKQNFRWLASTIQTRMKENEKLRKNYDIDNCIVTELRNHLGELLNPKDLIEEHSGPSGMNVNAVISAKFPLDEWENPEIGPWMKGAYLKSAHGQYWNSELEAWRINVKNSLDQSSDPMLSRGSSFVQVGYDFSKEDIRMAFDLDTKNMKWISLKQYGDAQIIKVIDVLELHYALICNIFAHYCGMGRGHLILLSKELSQFHSSSSWGTLWPLCL